MIFLPVYHQLFIQGSFHSSNCSIAVTLYWYLARWYSLFSKCFFLSLDHSSTGTRHFLSCCQHIKNIAWLAAQSEVISGRILRYEACYCIQLSSQDLTAITFLNQNIFIHLEFRWRGFALLQFIKTNWMYVQTLYKFWFLLLWRKFHVNHSIHWCYFRFVP